MDKVEITGRYTWEDYIAAYKGANRVSRWSKWINEASIILFAYLSLKTIEEYTQSLILGYVILGTVFFVYLARRFIPDKHKQEWFEDKIWNSEREYTFSSEEITSRSEYASTKVPWSAIVRWSEDDEHFYFFYSYTNYWFLPKRFFTQDELLWIEQQISENGIPKSKSLSKLGETVIWLIGASLLLLLRLLLDYSPMLK